MSETLEDFREKQQILKENEELKREVHAALETIKNLLVDLNKGREKIVHLESLLTQTIPVVKEQSKIIESVDPVEEIAIFQLERIRIAAKSRALTLEEARIYDLLVKNQKIAKEDDQNSKRKPAYRDVSDVELLKLVESDKETNERE